jgi:hypothetical protein
MLAIALQCYYAIIALQCYHAMDVTLCTASILHLSCISVDRFYAVVNKPLLYYDRMTSCKVRRHLDVKFSDGIHM